MLCGMGWYALAQPGHVLRRANTDLRAILDVGLFHGPGFERLPGWYKSGQFADVLDTGT